MKAKTFDKKFDENQDITGGLDLSKARRPNQEQKRVNVDFPIGGLDLSKARRPNQEQKRVNVDFPIWMIESLDKEAKHLGVTRQSIIKVWLAERLEKIASNN